MYQVQNPIEKAICGVNQSAGTYGSMMKNIPEIEKQGPTIGCSMMTAIGGVYTDLIL